eukprot:TRINITY_DN1000_c0_g1_i1.p1 TRINITY_DN1000_c0_g1~~TRINITY_DN1000_c0_g1_i1.p1  ORF type:complete len:710 (-),score=139.31 TRINITY_DN1000_c0_g1_i1:269-2149(-)
MGPGNFMYPRIPPAPSFSVTYTGSDPLLTNVWNDLEFKMLQIPNTARINVVFRTISISGGVGGLVDLGAGSNLTITNSMIQPYGSADDGLTLRGALTGGAGLIMSNVTVYPISVATTTYLINMEGKTILDANNCKFLGSTGPLINARTESTLISVQNSFISNYNGVLRLNGGTGSGNLVFYNNEVYLGYSRYPSGLVQAAPLTCPAGSQRADLVNQRPNNRGCGANSINNKTACPGVNFDKMNWHDGCGRCGYPPKGPNGDKDCNGVCFGTASGSQCRTPVALYANVTGTGSSCSYLKPCNIYTALLTAQYNDTVYAFPGSYRIANSSSPFSFYGKSFTIRSLNNDPASVEFTNWGGWSIPVFLINQGESFDSVLLNVTLSLGYSNIQVSSESAVSVQGSIIYGGLNNEGGGGIHVGMDGAFFANDTTFYLNSGTGSAIYLASPTDHFAYGVINNCRFTANNVNSPLNNAGTIYLENNANLITEKNFFYANTWLGYPTNYTDQFAGPILANEICSNQASATYTSFFNMFQNLPYPGLRCSGHGLQGGNIACPWTYTSNNCYLSAIVGGSSNIPYAPTTGSLNVINNVTCGCKAKKDDLIDCAGVCYGISKLDTTPKKQHRLRIAIS